MRETRGKFILFDVAGFADWLRTINVSRVVELVQNHHTWSPSYAHFKGGNHFELLNGMESAHLERGFAEIAQNLTTFPDGTIAVCRSFDRIPAGIKGANSHGICIEHVGNFDRGGDLMTDPHRATIVKVNALLCKKFRLEPDTGTIVYHHWYDLVTGVRTDGSGTTKTCPGTNFFGGNTVDDARTKFIPLVIDELATIETTPARESSILFMGTVASDMLNVRSLPSSTAPVVKVLARGILVHAYEEKNGWCRIDPNGSCWVNARYVERIADLMPAVI